MSDQQGGTRSAFGTEAEGTPEPEFLQEYAEAPEQPELPTQEAEPEPEPEPQPPDEGTPSEEPPKEEETPAPQGTVAAPDYLLPPELVEVLGGRFEGKPIAEVVAAFRNNESWATRAAQEAADHRRQYESLQKQHADEQAKVAPLLQWLNQAIQSGEIDPSELARYAPVEPQAPTEQPAQPDPMVQVAIQTFAQAHPEAVVDPSMDATMTRIVRSFRYDDETGTEDESEFPITAQNLEIAYTLAKEPTLERVAHDLRFIPSDDSDIELLREAATDRGLFQQLRANPSYLETDEGVEIARQQARLLSGYAGAQGRAPAQAQAQTEEMKRRAHVERGGSGQSAQAAPGKVAPEDMDADQLWDAVLASTQGTPKNIFGL